MQKMREKAKTSRPMQKTTKNNLWEKNFVFHLVTSSVADPDPPGPHVFGTPGSGSGSTSQRYGSGSFYLHAKIVRKSLIPAILRLFVYASEQGIRDSDPDLAIFVIDFQDTSPKNY